jgi:hypothetical protein
MSSKLLETYTRLQCHIPEDNHYHKGLKSHNSTLVQHVVFFIELDAELVMRTAGK